jgi:hypothetical protein
MRRALVVQALRYFEAIDRVRPRKVLGHEFGLVALNRTDTVPHQGMSVGLQSGDFVYPFLDVVLPKIALPIRRHLAYFIGTEGFGNGQQLHRIGAASTRLTCCRNTGLHGVEFVA